MARYDDLNTNMIAYSAVLSIVILVLVLQGTQALCYNMVNAVDARKLSGGNDSSAEVKREQLGSLDGFKKVRVIDETAPPPKKGEEQATKEVIQIPITTAQQLILNEFGAASPVPGT